MATRRSNAETASTRRKDGLLTTGDMARLTGNTHRTVRFYEEAKLLQPIRRTAGGHRLFSSEQLDRLRLVSELRAAGLALEEIRNLVDAKGQHRSGPQAARSILELLDTHADALRGRAALLQRLARDLDVMRRILRECADCPGRRGYPEVCRTCEVVTERGPTPSVAGVLWHTPYRSRES